MIVLQSGPFYLASFEQEVVYSTRVEDALRFASCGEALEAHRNHPELKLGDHVVVEVGQ